MPKRILTECPYCHRRVSVFGANILKTKGEHCCKGCKCISNVVIQSALYAIGSIAVVSSLLILVLYSAYGDHGDIRGVIYVLIPFIIFYILVPFFVKLEPCVDRSAVHKLKRKISPIPTPEVREAPKQKIQKKSEEIPDEPIELDVGDDFRASFARAKSMAKSVPSAESVSEQIQHEDISSGETEDDVKVYSRTTETAQAQAPVEENPVVTEQTEPEEVSLFGMGKTVIPEEVEEEDEEADNSEVSFLFGRKL